jgi:hypothetical protein
MSISRGGERLADLRRRSPGDLGDALDGGRDHSPGHGGADEDLALQHVVDGTLDLLGSGGLGQVAGGAGLERRIHPGVLRVNAQDQNPHAGMGRPEPARGLEAVQIRHGDVGDDEVGPQPLHGFEQRVAIGHHSGHLAARLEELSQPFEHHRMVIGKKHSGTPHVLSLPARCEPKQSALRLWRHDSHPRGLQKNVTSYITTSQDELMEVP